MVLGVRKLGEGYSLLNPGSYRLLETGYPPMHLFKVLTLAVSSRGKTGKNHPDIRKEVTLGTLTWSRDMERILRNVLKVFTTVAAKPPS